MWTLEDALPVVRAISAIGKAHGFSVALYGSVLVAGQSSKDLDLYFVESEINTSGQHDQDCLKEIAAKYGINCPGLTPMRTSRIELGNGKRIDAQFIYLTEGKTPPMGEI